MFDIPFHINRFISLTEVKHPLKTSNKIIYWPLMAFVNLDIGTSALELELILQTPLFPLPQGLWAPNLAR